MHKALRKDPAERYQTAGELARDVEAYLAGDVVQAKRGSGWYALRKLAKRYKGVAAVVATVLVLSVGLGVTMSALFAKTVTEYRDVEREVEVLRERLVYREREAGADEALQEELAAVRAELATAQAEINATQERTEAVCPHTDCQRRLGDGQRCHIRGFDSAWRT